MKYVIIGAGGTGGTVGAYMEKAGKDVTLIARGKHLEAMQKNGITIRHLWDGTQDEISVKACSMEEYQDIADVILVCVKGYSLDSVVPFIERISGKNTIVIPILNIYGTGGKLQEKLPEVCVLDGCIYVSANITEPGILLQHGEILRIVFGMRNHDSSNPILHEIAEDFKDSGIRGILSENIQRDALQKFAYVSPMGTAALFYNATAEAFQKEGEPREMFKALTKEIIELAEGMDIHFERDLVQVNLNILAELAPETTTSMQRDVMEGKQSEIDGLVYEVVRLGEKYGVETPEYRKAAEKFQGQISI